MSAILHTIPPVCSAKSRVLILGSFPSVRSREVGFFYGHPQNRCWKTLAAVFGAGTEYALRPQSGGRKIVIHLENGVLA